MAALSKVKVRIEGHYEVEDLPYGKDYVWVPAHALIECDCGQVMDADEHHTTCPNCGADRADVLREVAGRHLGEEDLHPWHPDYELWSTFKENRTEYQEWLELRSLDQG
ncbi:MAG TPA: hypothetical protein VFY57_04890 [Rubrobacteraceae bacterium]|nr:hypothetical protein [Rubrobacteraceae bacterium]